MPKVSISEAARLTGKPRSTLHRHIVSGTLSKESDGQGKPVLDIAELERVYGPLLQADMKQSGAVLHSAPSGTVAADRAEIEGLRRENALLRGEIEDVKRERQKWQEEADSWRKQAIALLPGPKVGAAPPKPEPKPAPPKAFRGFLYRLTGAG
jgi:hypothetical protein